MAEGSGTTEFMRRVFTRIRKAPGPVSSFEPGYLSITKDSAVIPAFPRKLLFRQEPRLVIVLEADFHPPSKECGKPLVALGSFCVEFAGPYDVIIPAERSPFGIPFMVECWNAEGVLGLLIEPNGYFLGDVSELVKIHREYVSKVSLKERYATSFKARRNKFEEFRYQERWAMLGLFIPSGEWIASKKWYFPNIFFMVPPRPIPEEISLGSQRFRVEFSETDEGTRISVVGEPDTRGHAYFWVLNAMGEHILGWRADQSHPREVCLSRAILPPGEYRLIMDYLGAEMLFWQRMASLDAETKGE